eukprot:13671-Heterococcus_DN1.PRE.1
MSLADRQLDEEKGLLQGSSPLDRRNAPIRARKTAKTDDTFGRKAVHLALCFAGLQGSYLTWGFVQEQHHHEQLTRHLSLAADHHDQDV